jgi:hypothetical protein
VIESSETIVSCFSQHRNSWIQVRSHAMMCTRIALEFRPRSLTVAHHKRLGVLLPEC